MNSLTNHLPHLNRRELLRIGGLSVLGGFLNVFRPHNVWAEQRVRPRATARQVLFINLEGGMSQVVGAIGDLPPVAELLERIMGEADATLTRLGA